MENWKLNKGIEKLKSVKLSSAEKSAILRSVLNSVPAEAESPSAYISFSRTLFIWQAIVPRGRHNYAIAGLLIILLSGGGVALAAEKSLPGELLYPVKIKVNEPARGALASSNAEKARWEIEKIERRLAEAEELAARGRLDDSSRQAVEKLMAEHSRNFDNFAGSAEKDVSPEKSLEVRVELEAKIAAHAKVLEKIESSPGNANKEQVEKLKTFAQKRINALKKERPGKEENILKNLSSENSQKGNSIFKNKESSVESRIKKTEERLESGGKETPEIDKGTRAELDAAIKRAKNSLTEAKDKNKAGETGRAYSALLDSDGASEEADTLFEYSLKLGKGKVKYEERGERADGQTKNDRKGK